MGRKSKLTPELQEKILFTIRLGNYTKTACLSVGITEASYYSWLAQGEKAKVGKYFEFLEAVKKAEAEGEAHLVGMVVSAGPTNWQAAMTILERKYPDRWGRKDRRDVDITSGGKPIKTYVGISPEQWDREQADD